MAPQVHLVLARDRDDALITRLREVDLGDEQRFFSYRRATHRNEKDYGRLISAIALT